MPEWFDNRYRNFGQQDLRFGDWDWGLEGCCGVEENLFLSFYVIYAVVFFLLQRWTLLKPVRLLTVFLHEFGHASGELL